MRQRRIKDLEKKLDIYSGGVRVNPRALKGRWNRLFEREQPLFLELGCGKGQFASSIADAFPERNVIAVEGNQSAMLRALQKAARHYGGYRPAEDAAEQGSTLTPALEAVIPYGMFSVDVEKAGVDPSVHYESPYRTSEDDCVYSISPNLAFANAYLRDVTDYFEDGEIDGIYLNFSDPWPKARQERRRLTHRRYLAGYRQILKPGGFLEFKTDNEGLFRFSMEEFRDTGLEIAEYTEDLHAPGCTYPSKDFMTEYEQKFSARGNRIFYSKVIF